MSQSLSKPTIALHWLTGLLFIGVLGLGLYVEDLARSPEKFELLATHKSLGIIVFAIAVVRLLWRFKEGPISSIGVMPKWQAITAKGIHYLLLIATLSMPLSGIIMTIGGGRALEFFGIQLLAAGEKIEWMSGLGHFVHVQSVNLIILALLLHVAGALKHQFIDKDGTLSRMLGRKV
jgi:cytochrome b561